MRHLRSDYDCIQPFPVKRTHIVKIDGEPLIPDDEPVFLIRGQDPVAGDVVHAWAAHAEAAGADPGLVARVHEWAEEMRAYATAKRHGPPDVPPGVLRQLST